jgi:hypothetical protein
VSFICRTLTRSIWLNFSKNILISDFWKTATSRISVCLESEGLEDRANSVGVPKSYERA